MKENSITLLTHSDPSELLPGDSLRYISQYDVIFTFFTFYFVGQCYIQNFQEKPAITLHPGLPGFYQLMVFQFPEPHIFISRYQVHLKDRGVLLQKRYLVNISK